MSERGSFYLTLPSDSSLKENPDNKTSSFTVSLPKSIQLHGSWEMALVEFQYPHTIQNVTKNNNKLVYQFKKKFGHEDFKMYTFSIEVPIGHYANINDLLVILNHKIESCADVKGISKKMFELNTITGRVECNASQRNDLITQIDILNYYRHQEKGPKAEIISHRLYLEGTLAIMLGFDPFEHNLLLNTTGENLPNTKLGISSKMILYCDIIEPQFIGHKQAQVLKTMASLEPRVKYGDVCERNFPILQYVEVMKTCFDKIHLDIRTSDGRLMPFAFGSSCALVHLRPKKT